MTILWNFLAIVGGIVLAAIVVLVLIGIIIDSGHGPDDDDYPGYFR